MTIFVYLCRLSAINKTHKKPAWRYDAHRFLDIESVGQDLAAELHTSLSNIRLEYARGDGMSSNIAVADLLGRAKAACSSAEAAESLSWRLGEALCLVSDIEATITVAASLRLEPQSAQQPGRGPTGASAGNVSVQSLTS